MRPESDITDYHTEFSGITQDQLVNVSISFIYDLCEHCTKRCTAMYPYFTCTLLLNLTVSTTLFIIFTGDDDAEGRTGHAAAADQ